MESLAHVSPRVRARVIQARGAQTSSAAARPFKVTVTPQRRGWRKHEIGQIKSICEIRPEIKVLHMSSQSVDEYIFFRPIKNIKMLIFGL